MREYADRDIEEQGEFYLRHVSAMTGENLHSKSAIAAELAHRDIRIERLEQELATARRDYDVMYQLHNGLEQDNAEMLVLLREVLVGIDWNLHVRIEALIARMEDKI